MGQFLVAGRHVTCGSDDTEGGSSAPCPAHLTSPWPFSSRALPWQNPGLFILVSNQTLTSSWHRLP